MATLHYLNAEHFNPALCPILNHKNSPHRSRQPAVTVSCSNFRTQAASPYKSSVPQHQRKNPNKSPRRLITISTSSGRWQSQWTCDYILSLRELRLEDLAEGEKNAEVLVSLTIQKHTSFGFSVDGRIMTCFKRKCISCFKSYHKEIDTTFDVLVLPSTKDSETQLPEIDTSDQVIYVKPGSEAHLDSVVQDTIRLIALTKDTCSESCEKSSMTWQYIDRQSSYDQRWSQLLEMKKAMQYRLQTEVK